MPVCSRARYVESVQGVGFVTGSEQAAPWPVEPRYSFVWNAARVASVCAAWTTAGEAASPGMRKSNCTMRWLGNFWLDCVSSGVFWSGGLVLTIGPFSLIGGKEFVGMSATLNDLWGQRFL